MSSGWTKFQKTGAVQKSDATSRLGLLIVDDEMEIVEALTEVFRSHFDIFHSNSAREALALFKTHGPKLVLSDQRMPELTGLELLRQFKEIDPDTIRILITGHSDINVVVQALNEGLLWRYVTKPWDNASLRALVLEGARSFVKSHPDAARDRHLGNFLGF
jgi:DNA-binding NtrC family response regulator